MSGEGIRAWFFSLTRAVPALLLFCGQENNDGSPVRIDTESRLRLYGVEIANLNETSYIDSRESGDWLERAEILRDVNRTGCRRRINILAQRLWAPRAKKGGPQLLDDIVGVARRNCGILQLVATDDIRISGDALQRNAC